MGWRGALCEVEALEFAEVAAVVLIVARTHCKDVS